MIHWLELCVHYMDKMYVVLYGDTLDYFLSYPIFRNWSFFRGVYPLIHRIIYSYQILCVKDTSG